MMVATVAQALTKERLIPDGSVSNPKATVGYGHRSFFAAKNCRFA
jgi:hypothetical protein